MRSKLENPLTNHVLLSSSMRFLLYRKCLFLGSVEHSQRKLIESVQVFKKILDIHVQTEKYMIKSLEVTWHHERDYFLVHRDQFLTDFDKRGLDTRLRHGISSFTQVTDRILPQKFTSIGFIVSGDRARTRYLRGLCGRKYQWKGPCRSGKGLVFGALRAWGPVDECREP